MIRVILIVAALVNDGTLGGKIFFHDGDDSGFKAARSSKTSARLKRLE